MSSLPSSPKRGCSPAYSSCSSEDPERKCLRCIEQKYNNGTSSNEFPTRGKFTRSFSVDSTQSFEELFKKSEETETMGQVQTVPPMITDFSAEGTKVLFCKTLNVTSDEDDEKKGIKRSYEDRRGKKRNGRYKRHCASEDYGDKLPSHRPPSRCSISSQIMPRTPTRRHLIIEDDISEDFRPSSRSSVRSDQSRLTAKKLPKRPVKGKEKSKPASNRNMLVTNLKKDSKSQQSQDSENSEVKKGGDGQKKQITKVPGKMNKYRIEDNEEVTIYEKTIITVTSSDNYIMGDPLSPVHRYNSAIPPMQGQKLANVITNQLKPDAYRPASIEVYGMPNKKTFRKSLLSRDATVTQSNDIQILPVIQELNNIGVENAKSSSLRGKTKSMSSTECDRDLVKSAQKSKAVTPNMNMLESKIHVRGFQTISHGSSLFPNSCMKKETIKTKSSQKSVRFMVSESQCNLGGETITKKSFRLEKFPPNKTKSSNVTAAPLVMRIENPTLELMKGALGGEVMENIICRETAERVIQEQLINKLGIINNMNSNGGHSVHNMLRGPSVISVPGEPYKFAIEGTKTMDNCIEKFRATSHNRSGTNDVTEVEYTLSDLGISRQKNNNRIGMDVQKNSNPEVKTGVAMKVEAKKNSLEQRRNEIRLKLNQPNSRNEGISHKKEESKSYSVVPRLVNKTSGGGASKPGKSGDAKTPAKGKERLVEKFDVNKKFDALPHPRRGRNKITSLSKTTNSKIVPKETITTLKSDQLLKKDNIQTEVRPVSTASKSTKIQSRPATSGTKPVESRDRSPMSGVSTMSGGVRPRSAELRMSSSGGLKAREVSESTVDQVTNGGYIMMEASATSSSRPPSRKPHMSSPNRSNKVGSESSDRSPGSPRTPLTLRPCGKPDLKTTSTIREHLRSSALQPPAPEKVHEEPERTDVKSAKRRKNKLSGHPLRFKTLSQFMIERQLSMGSTKKKNANDTRRISEPINHKR
ncbi:hypothetical protein GE061_017461 [Apolygus lucorum]|uniref:Uncharacterized protein n=1 Tax=Apolygus lucorum TaxID=248454 RepID=A0A8S9XB39_APOLU|nr:hypothetical protein GE061_017461 [Apolygus lucorum]